MGNDSTGMPGIQITRRTVADASRERHRPSCINLTRDSGNFGSDQR